MRSFAPIRGLSENKLLLSGPRGSLRHLSQSIAYISCLFFFAGIELLAYPAHLRGSWMVGLLTGLDHMMVGGLMTARRLAY